MAAVLLGTVDARAAAPGRAGSIATTATLASEPGYGQYNCPPPDGCELYPQGTTFAFIARVAISDAATPPPPMTGTVTFTDNDVAKATVAVVETEPGHGQATWSYTPQEGGPHTVVAYYSGDANYAPATSNWRWAPIEYQPRSSAPPPDLAAPTTAAPKGSTSTTRAPSTTSTTAAETTSTITTTSESSTSSLRPTSTSGPSTTASVEVRYAGDGGAPWAVPVGAAGVAGALAGGALWRRRLGRDARLEPVVDLASEDQTVAEGEPPAAI